MNEVEAPPSEFGGGLLLIGGRITGTEKEGYPPGKHAVIVGDAMKIVFGLPDLVADLMGLEKVIRLAVQLCNERGHVDP